MAVGAKTVDKIVTQMIYDNKPYSANELSKLTGYALPTIRQVIATAMMLGKMRKLTDHYPAKYEAIKDVPQFGETKIIKEPVPPLELSKNIQDTIKANLADRSTPEGTIGLIFEAYYKTITPVGRQDLVLLLFNFAEVIKEVIENEREIDPSDLAL